MTDTPRGNDTEEDTRKKGIDWADPSVPIGNSPPLPRWPLVVGCLAWVAWVAFLGAMVVDRGGSMPG